jgi:D-alanine--poly(phosphoribitol) ligase subunit 2
MIKTSPAKEDVSRVMAATIAEMNETQPDGQKIGKFPDTNLFGAKGQLDSLGLVNFIVLVEQRLADEFGVAVTLADEKALSRQKSPFLTVDSLTEYIVEQLEEVNR